VCCLTGLVEQFSRLKIAPEQQQRDFYQLCHRQPVSTGQPMPSLHDGQYTSREEGLALKPACAPYPHGKMQLSLLHPFEQGTSPVLDQLHLDSRVC
jgi:hypothetical protein